VSVAVEVTVIEACPVYRQSALALTPTAIMEGGVGMAGADGKGFKAPAAWV